MKGDGFHSGENEGICHSMIVNAYHMIGIYIVEGSG